MVASTSGTTSLKEYLKRYESTDVEENKKKKRKTKIKPDASGVLVVDEDPVWQRPINLDEEENDKDSADEKPQVDEDIEVRRMKRLEQLRARRAYNAIAEDGSGWISLSPKRKNIDDMNSDISPPRRQKSRNDTPPPEPGLRPLGCGGDDVDLSPLRQRKHHHTPSPDPNGKRAPSIHSDSDISPPRRSRARIDSPSPGHQLKLPRKDEDDFSPPRQRKNRYDSPSLEPVISVGLDSDLLPPRKQRKENESVPTNYILPRRQRQKHYHASSPKHDLEPAKSMGQSTELSSGRRRHDSSYQDDKRASHELVLSPPREKELIGVASANEPRRTGLISGRDIREEILKTKKDEISRFSAMDPHLSGKGAEPVFRDKTKGHRISKEDYLKIHQKEEEKPKEKLEWGKGLAQKREAEARLQELELERDKPFTRTKDDPELDKMLKERVRWGDPMAHLVKKKHTDAVLPDLGDNEKMKESGFIIPQDVPSHSWIKRGLDAAPNRYGIRPGRHWDGVDRSNGFEKKMFLRMNQKQATEREAYLWSVSDM